MNQNKEQNPEKEIYLHSLEEKLRSLSDIEVPPMLEAELLAHVPSQRPLNYHWFEFWGWGLSTACAAVILLGIILFHNSALSTSNGFVVDPVEMPVSWSMVKPSSAGFSVSVFDGEPNFRLDKEPNSGI